MITYKVVNWTAAASFPAAAGNGGYYVVAKESGVVVSGPWERKGGALADANLRASAMPGNRVES